MQINLNRPPKLFPCIMNHSEYEPGERLILTGSSSRRNAGFGSDRGWFWSQGGDLDGPRFLHLFIGNENACLVLFPERTKKVTIAEVWA